MEQIMSEEKNNQEQGEVTFEEIMFTIISATQDTFKMFMNIDMFSGKVERKVKAVHSDIVALIGIGGRRVGYIIVAADHDNAKKITSTMMMTEEVDDNAIRDAFGELANNIAGSFKSKYNETYGNVAMGLPLVMSGKIVPIGAESGDKKGKDEDTSVQVQKGVIIPFLSMKDLKEQIALQVMVYI